ncbi:hypothetical protein GCM10010399_59920 [Dactylosporangium fulvum]|uniref:Uncharacterized protein n=1 Tax=Dactylosporangium fulvum TaxID=53359 RepID=A0ABY5VT54_9ACTN|nr:hypothetical protein [Dactylosporangium fulvum]UWP80011.1 hypothetical protein Dfulv_33260 [Dactylosporangium fulvum]
MSVGIVDARIIGRNHTSGRPAVENLRGAERIAPDAADQADELGSRLAAAGAALRDLKWLPRALSESVIMPGGSRDRRRC